jgi:hypothetical protein
VSFLINPEVIVNIKSFKIYNYLDLRKPGRCAASRGPTVIFQPGSSSSTSPAIEAA